MSQKDIEKALQKHQPKLDQDYQKNLQVAKYTNLTDIEQSSYLKFAGIDKEGKIAYYFIDGNASHEFDDNKIIYYSISCMDKKIDQKYVIVKKYTYVLIYIIANENGPSEFRRFRKRFLNQLPAKYYQQLRQIYIYNANLLLNLKDGKFGMLKPNTSTSQFFPDFSIEDLLKLPNFIPSWLNLLPKELGIKQQYEPEYIEQPKGVFGVKLEYQKPNQYGIPIILDQLLSYFDYKGERFLKPDIFRKQGPIDEENQLFQLLNNENFDCLNVVDDIRLVSSMIKKFFTLLPEPLIPQHLLKYISTKITTITPETELNLVEFVLNKMPGLNRILLSVMASFLLTVGNYSEFNHMNMQNLAIVFAPCFMRAQTNDISSLEQIGHSVKFLKILFDHFDKMFPNFTYKLFLQPKKNPLTSSDSSNGSTGPDYSNKNQSNSSSESGEEKINEKQQKID